MASKQQKSNKMIAEAILRIQGITYDDWLDEQHSVVIEKNTDTIRKMTEMAVVNVNTSGSSNQNNYVEEG